MKRPFVKHLWSMPLLTGATLAGVLTLTGTVPVSGANRPSAEIIQTASNCVAGTDHVHER